MTLLDHRNDLDTPPPETGAGLLARLGRASGRHPRRVLLVWALALAVLLDATVIRMMLVPSLLGMLGERAWRIPGRRDRPLPHIDFAH